MERFERLEELAEAREDPRLFQEPSGGELSRSVTISLETALLLRGLVPARGGR